jgi:hypothetical protein
VATWDLDTAGTTRLRAQLPRGFLLQVQNVFDLSFNLGPMFSGISEVHHLNDTRQRLRQWGLLQGATQHAKVQRLVCSESTRVYETIGEIGVLQDAIGQFKHR